MSLVQKGKNNTPSVSDGEGMFEIEERFPENFEEALATYVDLSIPLEVKINSTTTLRYAAPSNVVIAGMGGSAIGGDFIRRLCRKTLAIPVEVCRSYELPGYVDDHSLVIATSYSGETEETLSCFIDGIRRRSMIIGISSGGRLASYCNKLNIPLFKVPAGYPPRAALPFILAALITVMSKFQLLDYGERDRNETLRVLRKVRDETKRSETSKRNLARRLASELTGSIIVIYAEEVFEEAARRWKDQLNENGKMLAKMEVLPELNHNDLVGWENSHLRPGEFSVVMLRDATEEPAMKARVDITTGILRSKRLNVVELYPKGRSLLSRILYLSYFGDMVSLYYAARRRVNPFQTEFITRVKKELADHVNLPSLLDKEVTQIKKR